MGDLGGLGGPHAGNGCTKKKIGLFAVLSIVIVIVLVVLAVKLFGGKGYTCSKHQILNNCSKCSDANTCTCKDGFHNSAPSNCAANPSPTPTPAPAPPRKCSEQQKNSGCMPGTCTQTACTCKPGHLNNAKD